MMKKTVDFQFDLNQKVKTSLGMEGIVSMLGYDLGGIHYFVKGIGHSNWYPESQLTAVE